MNAMICMKCKRLMVETVPVAGYVYSTDSGTTILPTRGITKHVTASKCNSCGIVIYIEG